MIRRICTLTAIVVLALLAMSPAASAQYGGGDIDVDGNILTGHICEGPDGPRADVPVDIFIDGVFFETVFTDENGDFTVELPADLPPGTVITAQAFTEGGGLACVLSTEIPGAGEEPLPRTGSNDTVPLTRIGIAAIAAGGLLVLVSRKRAASSKVDVTA